MTEKLDDVFREYLRTRWEQAGAVTAGQKLEVLRSLRREAQEGQTPVGRNSVARLDPSDPRVQAILRGEAVSLPGASAASASPAAVPPVASAARKRLGKTKIPPLVVMLLLFLVPIAVAIPLALHSMRASAAPPSTPTVPLTATLAGGLDETPTPTSTPVAAPTATPEPQTDITSGTAFFDQSGEGPASGEVSAPASIELNNVAYAVREGALDDETGLWSPAGIEWLPGTLIRRVIAMPAADLSAMNPHLGDRIYLRLRSGYVVTYVIVQAETVAPNRIELLNATKPSIALIGYGGDGGAVFVVIGEIYIPGLPQIP